MWLRQLPSYTSLCRKFLPLALAPQSASKADNYFKEDQEKEKEKWEGKRVLISALWKIVYYSKERTPSWAGIN